MTFWDVFLSHASEDKPLVEELARRLRARGIFVWYDADILRLGDSLREKIDHGLAHCRVGVVVLSESFFAKRWTKAELDGLTALGSKILPVRHGVSPQRVTAFSPMLGGQLSLDANDLDKIVDHIVEMLSRFPMTDHNGKRCIVNTSSSEYLGEPITPDWMFETPERFSSQWLRDRFERCAHLRIYKHPCGTYFMVDLDDATAEPLCDSQYDDLKPHSEDESPGTTPDANRYLYE